MTDRQVFEKVMSWMGMEIYNLKTLKDGDVVVEYIDESNSDGSSKTPFDVLTTTGYDEFYAGAIFDPEGNMRKGYIDSHVAYSSDNAKLIAKYFKEG